MPGKSDSKEIKLTLDNVLESKAIDWSNIPVRKEQDLYDTVKPFRHIILKLLTDFRFGWDKIPAIQKPLKDRPTWVYK